MKYLKYLTIGVATMLLGMNTACTGDLDVTPDDPNKKTELVSEAEWMGYFGSLYGNFIYEGNLTPTGVDGGAGTFSRCHWNLQELSADGVILLNTWNDPGYPELKTDTWSTNFVWGFMCFQREATTARTCVEFLSKVDNAKNCGVSEETIAHWKAEARVLHAFCYYYMIDMFGKGPWVGEDVAVGQTPPTYSRSELFEATTQELIDVINSGDLLPAGKQEYGRVSKEAARMLLAKLYLNAEVYTGQKMYDKCAEQIQEILKTINTLAPTYKYLFCDGNQKYCNGGEILWSIPADEVSCQTYGSTTYLTAGAYFGSIPAEDLLSIGGTGNTWNGLKIKPELYNAFTPGDYRRLFYEGSFNLGVDDLNSTEADSDGYMCIKYRRTTEDDYFNTAGNVHSTCFTNIDFPVFRLADAYLMLTECQLRGVSNADPNFKYFNAVRKRAGLAELVPTLDDLLVERQCELYWEGHRRSDLVRFGKFSGNAYVWSWKGGVPEGTGIASYRDLYPIPYQYESTVGQNPGY